MPASLGLLFGDLGLERVFRLEPGLVADGGEILLHLLLDREFDLALGVFELTLFAQHIGLGLLGFGELRVVRGKHLLQIGKLPVPLAKIIRQRQDGPSLPRLRRWRRVRRAAWPRPARRGFAGLGEIVLRLPELGFATAEIGLLGRELRLELLARGGDQRGRKGFGQLDLGAAVRADDLGVAHAIGPLMVKCECIRVSGISRDLGRGVIPGNRGGRGSGDARCGAGFSWGSRLISVPRGAEIAFAQDGLDNAAQPPHRAALPQLGNRGVFVFVERPNPALIEPALFDEIHHHSGQQGIDIGSARLREPDGQEPIADRARQRVQAVGGRDEGDSGKIQVDL